MDLFVRLDKIIIAHSLTNLCIHWAENPVWLSANTFVGVRCVVVRVHTIGSPTFGGDELRRERKPNSVLVP